MKSFLCHLKAALAFLCLTFPSLRDHSANAQENLPKMVRLSFPIEQKNLQNEVPLLPICRESTPKSKAFEAFIYLSVQQENHTDWEKMHASLCSFVATFEDVYQRYTRNLSPDPLGDLTSRETRKIVLVFDDINVFNIYAPKPDPKRENQSSEPRTVSAAKRIPSYHLPWLKQKYKRDVLIIDISQSQALSREALMAHELQHIFRSYLNEGKDSAWFNEGLSKMAEWALARTLPTSILENFSEKPLASLSLDLVSLQTPHLVSAEVAGLFYSHAFFFLTWVVEHFGGKELLKRLLSSPAAPSPEALTAAILAGNLSAGQRKFSGFQSLFRNFHLALYLNPFHRQLVSHFNLWQLGFDKAFNKETLKDFRRKVRLFPLAKEQILVPLSSEAFYLPHKRFCIEPKQGTREAAFYLLRPAFFEDSAQQNAVFYASAMQAFERVTKCFDPEGREEFEPRFAIFVSGFEELRYDIWVKED